MKAEYVIRFEEIRDAYLAACRLDVTVRKPGNVSETSPGHGMRAEDFYRSAAVSADSLCDPTFGLGERVYNAVSATRAAVGCNTNLGILLLWTEGISWRHMVAAARQFGGLGDALGSPGETRSMEGAS